MRILLLIGLIALAVILTGCGEGITTQNQQKELVQLTPDEWSEISDAESYCQSLNYFDSLGGESVMDCEKDQLSDSLWDKLEEYNSVEQQELRAKIGNEAAEKEKLELQKNYNLSIGATANLPKKEITLASMGWSESNSGILVKIKIKNLDQFPLTVELNNFDIIDSEAFVYSPSVYSESSITYPITTIPAGEEVIGNILFKLEPDKAKNIVGFELRSSSGSLLASWI